MHPACRQSACRSATIELLVLVGCLVGPRLDAQSEYRNTDAGHPLRVEDATPIDRFVLDMHFPTARVERIGDVARLRVEPALSYGILPRTAIEARAAFVYRERAAVPRGGMTGVAVNVMHAFTTESPTRPGVAMVGEYYQPAGSAKGGGPAYSFRLILTQRVSGIRLHVNTTLGSYNVTVTDPGESDCVRARLPVVDQSCSGESIPPVIPDGPCDVGGADGGSGIGVRCDLGGSARAMTEFAPALRTVQRLRGVHRVVGLGADRTFPRGAVVIGADVFAERYVGLFDRSDWTAEVGGRHQVSASITMDAAVGRRFAGVTTAWVFSAGLTGSAEIGRHTADTGHSP